MAEWTAFPDIEAALVTLLEDLATTDTATPANLQTAMPFIRVTRFGGADDRFTDSAAVNIDTFAATRADSLALAQTILQRLISGPQVVGTTTLDYTTTATAPNEVPWSDDQTIRRFSASYRLSARRSTT